MDSKQENVTISSCIIQQLKDRPFLERTKEEQIKIMQKGRPKPVMPKLTKKYQNINRRFNPRHYTRYEWLAGSEKLNKLFCWYCLLFEEKKNSGKYLWSSTGYSNMRQLVMAATRHAFSQNHHKNMNQYHKFNETLESKSGSDLSAVGTPASIVKKANIRRCLINQILGMPFLERPLKEQIDIFGNGRPTPPMPLLFTYDINTNTRIGFQSDNYSKYKWLAGSQKLNRLYCWFCLLFADSSINETWISIGFNKMDLFFDSAEEHAQSKLHLEHEKLYCDFNKNFYVTKAELIPLPDIQLLPVKNEDSPTTVKLEVLSQEQDIKPNLSPDGQLEERTPFVENNLSQFFYRSSTVDSNDQTVNKEGTPVPDIANEPEAILPTSPDHDYEDNFHDNPAEFDEQFEDEKETNGRIEEEEEEEEEESAEPKYAVVNLGHQGNSNCIIKQLLEERFPKLNENIQRQILMTGRPVPDTSQFSKLGNVFYNKYDWLTASTETNKYYCWFCLLMKEPFEATFWGEEGIGYARNVPKRIERHANSQIHFNSYRRYNDLITKLGIYLQPIRLTISEPTKPNLQELLDKHKNDTSCTIIQLLRNKFQTRTLEEQREIIEKGRPTPELPNLHGVYASGKRNFRPIYYQKYQWLCGSAKLNKLFCWYCLLCDKSVWGREGVTNICKLTESLKKHNVSSSHEMCVAECNKFGKNFVPEDKQTHELIVNILSNSKRCLINELLGYPFVSRPLANRVEIVRNGRPIPDSSDGEPFIANFFNINYYKYEWLTGSKKLKKLFCWPCLLFADSASTNVWVQVGFDNVRKLSTAASKHENSKVHYRHLLTYSKFKRKHCSENSNKGSSNSVEQKEMIVDEVVSENKSEVVSEDEST